MYILIKRIIAIPFLFSAVLACNEKKAIPKGDFVIAEGQMPNLAKDNDGNVHLIYGIGDSIMYTSSTDEGRTFAKPSLVAVLPKLFSFAMRGPQISASSKGIMVTGCTTAGNIFSYYKENGSWKKGARVNDVDTVAKEGLMGLAADGENAYAIWLDTRDNGGKGQRVFGAKSSDGGKSWTKNILVYASPDKTVCECCKPSVAMQGKNVFVMFRNWLNGNRNLYVIQSHDGGDSFGQAQKLGMGDWKLNGCPMDGGALAIGANGAIQTVWKREAKIYAATPNMPEQELGEGRSCTLETVNGKNVYAWSQNGELIFTKANGQKEDLGKGIQPVLKVLDDEHVLCVWENEKKIHGSVVEL